VLCRFRIIIPNEHHLSPVALNRLHFDARGGLLCGQAPSDFPEITRWLVDQGIDSISLNPDSVLKMTEVVVEMERQQAQAAGN